MHNLTEEDVKQRFITPALVEDAGWRKGDVKASKQHGARRRAVERMPRWA